VALLVRFHLGVIYFFVIHMRSMVTETTAMPPPPSKDTSSIDLDMLFADWQSYTAFLLEFIVIHTNYSY